MECAAAQQLKNLLKCEARTLRIRSIFSFREEGGSRVERYLRWQQRLGLKSTGEMACLQTCSACLSAVPSHAALLWQQG